MTDFSEDVITPKKTVMEVQQTVSFSESVGPIKLTNIRIHFQWTMLILFPEHAKWRTSEKHLTQISFEITQYIKILKDVPFHNANSSTHNLAPLCTASHVLQCAALSLMFYKMNSVEDISVTFTTLCRHCSCLQVHVTHFVLKAVLESLCKAFGTGSFSEGNKVVLQKDT